MNTCGQKKLKHIESMQSRTSTQDMLPKLDLHGGRGAPDKDCAARSARPLCFCLRHGEI